IRKRTTIKTKKPSHWRPLRTEHITGLPCRSILQRVWFTFPRRPMVAARSRSKRISFTSLENEIPESSAPALARRVLLLRRSDRCHAKDNTLRLSPGILSRKRNVGELQVEEPWEEGR